MAISKTPSKRVKEAPATKVPCKAMPKKRCRETTTQKLLEAGVEVFSKLGFDGATTKLVAKKAGVAEALIIRYFGSKDGLLAAILEVYIERIESSPLCYPPQKTLEEEIVHYLLVQNKRDPEMKNFLKVSITHAFTNKKFAEKIKEFASKGGSPVFRERLKILQEKGEVSKSADFAQIATDIKFYSFSNYFFGELLMQMPAEALEKCVRSFAKTYSRGINA
jgi:AcrR family transcriptional regulator